MKEECKVLKIKGDRAYISLANKEKCGGCKACGFGRGKKVSLPAVMDVPCCVGDTVIAEIPQKDSPMTLFLFIIPLVFLIIGFIVGGFVAGGGDLIRFGFALGLCAVSGVVVFLFERRFSSRREYTPVITEVVKTA